MPGLAGEKDGLPESAAYPSCTHALELCALLADIKPGDEVIMSSFTHHQRQCLRPARRTDHVRRYPPDTLNIDEKLIEDAVTARTRAIVPMHYAGVACEMASIMEIAARHNLLVIEDAAPSIMCFYKKQAAW